MLTTARGSTFGAAWRLRSIPCAIAALGVAVIFAGCGGPAPRPAPSKTPTSSPRASALTTEDIAVLTAYRAGWRAFVDAATAGDPSAPQLAATMVNPLLQAIQKELVRRQKQGAVLTGDVTLHPHVVSVTGDTAVVDDCAHDASKYVFKGTTVQVPPVTQPGNAGFRATLTREVDGTWKVSDQAREDAACSSS